MNDLSPSSAKKFINAESKNPFIFRLLVSMLFISLLKVLFLKALGPVLFLLKRPFLRKLTDRLVDLIVIVNSNIIMK
jgi:hypothetical protein